MKKHISPKLRYSLEYRQLYQPMSQQEYSTLEKELKHSKEIVSIKTWRNIVLFDYEKYEICKKYNIKYIISRVHTRNSEEALLWLCKNQLKRMDLTSEMRKYLIGKRYLYERMLCSHNAGRKLQSKEESYGNCLSIILEQLSREYNVANSTLWKYGVFAEALDIIYNINAELAIAVKNGTIKLSQENTVAISKLPENEILNVAESLLNKKHGDISFADSQQLVSKMFPKKTNEMLSQKQGSIKDMPKYDPDAEVASLILTIPSWISFMKRVYNVSDMTCVSKNSKVKLRDELDRLITSIQEMMTILKEEKLQ